MTQKYFVEPDLEFIDSVVRLGGDTLKKCFQCATCSVACPIAPEDSPFPRKEMMAASWGLKDKLVGSGDIWLCHECGDCTELCPRGAKPGDVLSAVRTMAIKEYSQPKIIGKLVNDVKGLPILLGVPALWFALLAMITVFGRDTMIKIFGKEFWTHGVGASELAHTNFVSTWFIDITFIPLATFAVVTFALGLKRFVTDMHNNAVLEGKTEKFELNIGEMIASLKDVIPTILKHSKFDECGENKERSTSHMMVLYGFIGCFIATAIAGPLLYLGHLPGPYSQINPVKLFGNVGGIAIVIGSVLMIKARLDKKDKVSAYKDWYILGLVFALGSTGLLSEMTRVAGSAPISYFFYYLHLICIFNLFAFIPFSKMAHIVYRITAMTYAAYGNRKY